MKNIRACCRVADNAKAIECRRDLCGKTVSANGVGTPHWLQLLSRTININGESEAESRY